MGHSLLCMMGFFLLSTAIYGNAEELKATLTANSTTIPAGGSVTLTCDVKDSADLEYVWFRESSSEKKVISISFKGEFIIHDGGIYTCRGRRRNTNLYTTESNAVTIQETAPPKPTVVLQPSRTQIYSGERVTVRCEIQGGEGAQWTYEWSPAKLNTPPTSNEYTIRRATESDGGGYSCRGRRDYFFTEWSDTITLRVL